MPGNTADADVKSEGDIVPLLKSKDMRLDMYDDFPSGMKAYLSAYGWHFSKAMCDWAISMMEKKMELARK